MDGSLTYRLETAERALATLRRVLAEPASDVVRDASFQRFDYCFEATWKLVKAYLARHQGLPCEAPKACFRTAVQAGLLSPAEGETALRMTDDRNVTSHAYLEHVAVRGYAAVPVYATLMEKVAAAVRGSEE